MDLLIHFPFQRFEMVCLMYKILIQCNNHYYKSK